MKNTFKTSKALVTVGLLLALAGWLLPTSSLEAQTAAPGWTLNVHATSVSTVSGGEALAADLATGDLFVKSLQDPGGSPVQVARVTPDGAVVTILVLPLQNSDASGIAIDPLTGGIIVADEVGGSGGRIALVLNLSTLTVSTLFDVPWTMNPNSNGTGQQQYAPDPGNPNILYFFDRTVSKLFRLDRSTNALLEILAIDQGNPDGQHFLTIQDILFDPATGTLLANDLSSNSVIEVDHGASPATVTTLFSGVFPNAGIALNPLTNEVFVGGGNSIFVGPRVGGSLSLVASGFTFLTDIVVGNATAGCGLSLFAVDKAQDTVYEITAAVPVDVAVTRYGTRGPNLPGMCSRLNCMQDKTHTVVVENMDTISTTINISIVVDAVPAGPPSNACTVNGVGAGGALPVATSIPLAPGASFSQNIDLDFQCSPVSSTFIGQNYVLRAHVENISGCDPNPLNNDVVKTQTVK